MSQDKDIMALAMQLHEQFPIETAFFVEFIQATIQAVKNNFTYNKQKWVRGNSLLEFDVWADYMDTINERIKDNKSKLRKDPKTFAQLLFGDQSRMFPLHCLYVLAQAIPENDRFNSKVIELFF